MQMVSGARVGSALGLIFRGSLWRDPPETRILVVETLHRRVLRNRRVSRRAKADFFSVAGIIEHLRKVRFATAACLPACESVLERSCVAAFAVCLDTR